MSMRVASAVEADAVKCSLGLQCELRFGTATPTGRRGVTFLHFQRVLRLGKATPMRRRDVPCLARVFPQWSFFPCLVDSRFRIWVLELAFSS